MIKVLKEWLLAVKHWFYDPVIYSSYDNESGLLYVVYESLNTELYRRILFVGGDAVWINYPELTYCSVTLAHSLDEQYKLTKESGGAYIKDGHYLNHELLRAYANASAEAQISKKQVR